MKRMIIAFIALMASVLPAMAQGLETITTKAPTFSFYVGAHGMIANADLDIPGAPINLGSNGYGIGGRVGADASFGSFFAGAMIDADKVFGDLEKLGVDYDLSAALRVGYTTNLAKFYVLAGMGRTFGDGFDIDYAKAGGGLEAQIGQTNWSARVEYEHRFYDAPGGLDLSADIVRAGVNYRF